MRAAALLLAASALLLNIAAVDGAEESAWVDRLEPFGGARGETVEVTLTGRNLTDPLEVVFDDPRLTWSDATPIDGESVRGTVHIAADAPLGPHIATLRTARGRTNSRLFYVDALRSVAEVEPNDTSHSAQPIELSPQILHGMLPELSDRDYYRFAAKAGERWVFDVRSIEYGGFLECNLTLLDDRGRKLRFSDDRDDYLETPTLAHEFGEAGDFTLMIDQYRGPQGVNCNNNCGYMLRISQTPVLRAAFPMGARRGSTTTVSLRGSGMEGLRSAKLLPLRSAEYYRLTFPYSIPIEPAGLPAHPAIEGELLAASARDARVRFEIPAEAPKGLWRLWLETDAGPVDGISLEIADLPEQHEETRSIDLAGGPSIVNGSLDADQEEDALLVQAQAGQPLHFSILAVQLGLPSIDPLLELFDDQGVLLAEHDDLMTGQGTVLGNPDPSLYYTPETDGELRLVVRDRIGRGGPDFVYRLRADEQRPGFQLLADPESVSVQRGGEGSISVLLIRDPGFEGVVEIWAEAPEGLSVGSGAFRADQVFGPSADGDNMIIPTVRLPITVAETTEAGDQPIRIFGRAPDGTQREAFSTLWIGPPRGRNDVRRPLPHILVSVRE